MDRHEIEQFCHGFFQSGEDYLQVHMFLARFDDQFASINIDFTSDNFNDRFLSICKNLFSRRPVNSYYVLAVLGFAREIDNRLKEKQSSWYKSDRMVALLSDILMSIEFSPKSILSNMLFS